MKSCMIPKTYAMIFNQDIFDEEAGRKKMLISLPSIYIFNWMFVWAVHGGGTDFFKFFFQVLSILCVALFMSILAGLFIIFTKLLLIWEKKWNHRLNLNLIQHPSISQWNYLIFKDKVSKNPEPWLIWHIFSTGIYVKRLSLSYFWYAWQATVFTSEYMQQIIIKAKVSWQKSWHFNLGNSLFLNGS